jgi:elongation factor G
MWATELSLGVVSCASGVTFNLRKKMQRARQLERGRAFVVTHIDAEHADFDQVVSELRSMIGEICIPVMVPNQSGGGFSAVTRQADPAWRKRLCDRVMDACEDEGVVMEYLESGILDDDLLHAHMPRAIAQGALVPVFACHPESGLGVPELTWWLREFAPCPSTKRCFSSLGERVDPDPDAELRAIVFGVKSDLHMGKVCLARIVSGHLDAGSHVGAGKGEKLGGLFHALGGKQRVPMQSALPGDIVGFSKVDHLGWGATFGLASESLPEAIDAPSLPTPMVARAIVPHTRADEQKIGAALRKLEAEDSTLYVKHDPLTHELVLHGMSELHLSVLESRLRRRYGVGIDVSLPRIAYRETITMGANAHYRHKKQSGGRGQFGECSISMKPGVEDSGIVFIDKVVGGAIPRNLIPAVEKGIRELAEQGILTGSRVVDVEVELLDGKFHAADSDEASFRKAGAMAFREGFSAGKPVLLEPIMEMEIHIPADSAGTIFSDLTSHRRGTVVDQGSEEEGAVTVVTAHVPLAEVQTYQRELKSQTAGEGTYSLKLDHYSAVPKNEQARVLARIEELLVADH